MNVLFKLSHEIGRANEHRWQLCEGTRRDPDDPSPNETRGTCPSCGNRMRLAHRHEFVMMPIHYLPKQIEAVN